MALTFNPEGYKGSARTAKEAVRQCVLANRILANENVVDAFGHVSVRNPENPGTFFQSRSVIPSMVTEADMLEIDLEGNVVTKTDARPYGERFIHSAILKARPEMNAVFHGHPHRSSRFRARASPSVPSRSSQACSSRVFPSTTITMSVRACWLSPGKRASGSRGRLAARGPC